MSFKSDGKPNLLKFVNLEVKMYIPVVIYIYISTNVTWKLITTESMIVGGLDQI